MRRVVPILILVVCALALYIDFFPGAKFFVISNANGGMSPLETKLGLDLKGGYSVTYRAMPTTNSDGSLTYPDSGIMAEIRNIVESRVNSTGAGEIIVETQGTDRITVQVPGAANPQQIRDLVGQSGKLTFIPLDRTTYGYMNTTANPAAPVAGTKPIPAAGTDVSDGSYGKQLFGGDQVDGNSSNTFAKLDTQTNKWAVELALKSDASKIFSDWSSANIGSYFMIVLDGKVVEQPPYIQQAITTGQAEISGGFDKTSANQLALILQEGALPNSLQLVTDDNIPATLGKSFMDQTLFAGAIGILLVMLFMLVYYRLPGLVACLALSYYGVAVLALFRIVPVTLSLAGIAGFVLSVGMAVDANILIFERTKEELRSGKTLVSAMEAGFNRALNSIIDSNVSTLITATILWFGGSPTVKGFALVLIIGVLTSMFTAVTVSRRMLRLVVHQEFAQHARLYGVTDEEFKARAVRMGRREARGRV